MLDRVPPPRTVTLNHTSTTPSYVLVGEVRPAAGMEAVGFDVDIMQVSGGLQVLPGLLWFATRPNEPDSSPSALTGSYTGSTGHHAFQESLSNTNKFFVAPVLLYALSSDGQGTATVQVKTTWKSAGRLLGTRDVVVNPLNDSAQVSYYPLTGWLPALGASKVMASIVAMDVNNGSVETALGIRTALDPTEPDSVVNCESSFDAPGSGNSARNTTALDIPAGANITTRNVFQLVLQVQKASGGSSNSRGIFRVSTALITS